jgi:hypothetical protein
MKTLKILFRALATYIASRCYKKLISSEEVTGEFSIKTLQSPDIDSIVYINSAYGLRGVQEPTRKTLLTKDSREIELDWIMKRMKMCKEHPDMYKMKILMKKYVLDKELVLHVLEFDEQHSFYSEFGYIHQFQWIG